MPRSSKIVPKLSTKLSTRTNVRHPSRFSAASFTRRSYPSRRTPANPTRVEPSAVEAFQDADQEIEPIRHARRPRLQDDLRWHLVQLPAAHGRQPRETGPRLECRAIECLA